MSRKSVFNYRELLEQGGVAGLLRRDWASAHQPAAHGAVAEEYHPAVGGGQFRQARDAQAWIKSSFILNLCSWCVSCLLPSRSAIVYPERTLAGTSLDFISFSLLPRSPFL